MSDLQRWLQPNQWRRPARVAFGNVPEVNPQDPAQRIVLEGDAEVVPSPLRDADGKVAAAIADADVLVSGFAQGRRYDEAFFAGLRTTRLFVRPFVGYDDIDIDAATAHGVLVCNMADAIYEDVSNQTMALMLGLDRQVIVADRWVRSGNWPQTGGRRLPEGMLLHRPLVKTLGIVGLGPIGRAVVKKARVFGYRIIAADPYIDPAVAQEYDVELMQLDDLLRQADVVSLHTYLNAETRKLMNAEKFALMKPSAVIVNTSRGPVIDEAALIDALKNGTIAGAGLDVFEVEPLPADSPLLTMDNVILSAHIAGTSVEGHHRMRTRAGEVALQVASGGLPQRHMVANKGLYDALAARAELAGIPRY
ncbi:MAG: C-terminal binding protein [Thermomicrobiales bacterium]